MNKSVKETKLLTSDAVMDGGESTVEMFHGYNVQLKFTSQQFYPNNNMRIQTLTR